MATNECSVVNPAVYGPYKQTIFLGCSVLGFTATAGWNGQNSEVTVELAQDTCSPPADRPKRYWANPTTIFPVAQLWYGADPGFTFPNVGAPVYFRVEDFEYSGLIQGWTVKESPSGSPVYTVKIVDPRPVLDHTQIILDSYEGSVNGVYNLLNVYAYLEYTSGGTGNSDRDCVDNIVGGIGIGAPAQGFGGAQRTERGIPWDLIKDGIQDLAGSVAGTPNSRFSMGGVFYREGSNKGWGELNFGNSGNVGTAKYIVDISDVPDAYFAEYRIAGPITSLSELINQVCQDAGCDYYVELLPTSGQLIIKVRTISRRNQPAMIGISNFILGKNILYGGEGIVNDSYGRELRSEINTSFVIGAKARQYFEQEASSYMTPFWGYDAEGNLMESKLSSGTSNNWQVLLDFRKINLALNTPVGLGITTNSKGSNGFGWVEEVELRFAQGDFDTFLQRTMADNNADTVLNKYLKTTIQQTVRKVKGSQEQTTSSERAQTNAKPGDSKGGDPIASNSRDAQAIYNWIRSYSSAFYGKQFLFQVPYVCKTRDSTSGKEVFSDEPSTEGAWPSLIRGGSLVDNTDLLGITVPSIQADFFRDETGKVQPMVKLTGANLDTSALNVDEYLVNGNNLWIKATIEDEWIQGTPVQGVNDNNIYAALLKISAPVHNKVAAVASKTNTEVTVIKKGFGDTLIINADECKNHLDGLGPTTGAVAFEAVMPIAGGVPLKSNTRTYGPWYRSGANPGAVSCEIDEGLAPWEYGGIAFMDKAGRAKVHNAVTSMQYGERGEVTIPGYPRISLGSALSTNPPSFLYDGRQMGTGGHSWPRGGWSYNYVAWNSPSESTTGATVSNINVTVGTQGVTTSYTISTFTPVFGRFAKGNAERLKQIGLNKLSGERELRARNALKRLLRTSEGRLGAQGADHGVGVNSQSPKSAAVLFAGKLVEDKQRKVVLAGTLNTFPYYRDYDNTSMMSMDGFFRPVSNYGDASLPKINNNNAPCEDQPTQAAAPPPPVEGYTGLSIRQKYLDFLADPVSNTTLLDDERSNSSTSGHDIESVARKSLSWLEANQPGGTDSLFIHISGQQSYADDYRYMATRGPMVMQGWGYDLHGKPIPNASGDSAGSFSTNYNLTDKFKENWLSDAREWPVAPIDLRFDRKRGVWTTPPAFRLYQVEVSGSIDAGADGKAKVIKHKSDLYDADGNLIDNPLVEVENWTKSTVASGDKALAYYDTADCKYWLIPIPSGSGSGLNVGSSGCGNDLPCAPVSCLVFNSGLELEPAVTGTGTGTAGAGTFNVYGPKISFEGDCAPTGSGGGSTHAIPATSFEMLSFSTGFKLQAHAVDASGNERWTDGILPSGTGSGVFGSGFSGNADTCRFRVLGPTISFTGCGGTAAPPTSFDNLMFGSGLNVTPISGGSGERGCGYEIMGPKVSSEGDCAPTGSGGGSTHAIPAASFEMLSFSSGLKLQAHAVDASGNERWTDGILPSGTGSGAFGSGFSGNADTCRFRVLGPTISFTGCETEGTYFPPAYFDNLMFASGLNVTPISGGSGERDCGYEITGPSIAAYECSGCSSVPAAPFQQLSFGTGLTLEPTGDCGYVVQGPTWSSNEKYLCQEGNDVATGTSGATPFCSFEVRRGIDLRSSGSGCEPIKGMLAINYGGSTESSNLCANPVDGPSWSGPTNTLELGIGIEKICDYTGVNDCKTLIAKNLEVGPEGGMIGPYITGIELISSPCEMILAHEGSECSSVAATGADRKFSTVRLGTKGIDLEIPVVTGVCCSGDTLQVNFQKLTFCSGLLQAIEPTGGPVCPE